MSLPIEYWGGTVRRTLKTKHPPCNVLASWSPVQRICLAWRGCVQVKYLLSWCVGTRAWTNQPKRPCWTRLYDPSLDWGTPRSRLLMDSWTTNFWAKKHLGYYSQVYSTWQLVEIAPLFFCQRLPHLWAIWRYMSHLIQPNICPILGVRCPQPLL